MGKRDKRVDAYIARSADFAQPILTYIRDTVHEGCPEVEETLKWSMPAFMYKGLLCNMAAFKEHCAFGFWKSALVLGKEKTSDNGMGVFGKLKTVKDLPSKKDFLGYVKKAAELNESGTKVPKKSVPASERKPLEVPSYFAAALKKNKKAAAHFDAFSPGKKKEYVQWITEAKTEETRNRRMETAVEWISEGKARNWKYEKC